LIPASRITLPHCSYSLRRNAVASRQPDAGSRPIPTGARDIRRSSPTDAIERSITAERARGREQHYQFTATRGVPASAAVGTFGMALEALRIEHRERREAPSFT